MVNRFSQLLRNPSESHWLAAVRVVCYVITTKSLKQKLGGNLTVSGYFDSNWAEGREDKRSARGYVYWLGVGTISWKLKKQATVLLSSTKAKYKAMLDSCKEGLWLRNILTELSIRPRSALPLHVDNEGAEALANNPEHHSRTKHIDARYHFVRDCVKDDIFQIVHVSTHDMLADMLTKPLPRVLLEKHRLMFGLV